ncbi:MAG: hypothetical protein OET63_01765 [Desulfobacterales bacterium]|jgi:hypothetical protein|nr:hypothetical protein [Desulfobacterales bacterium]
MAKKKKQEDVAVEEVAVATQKPTPIKPVKKDDWEVKDRTYILTQNKEPLTFTIPAKHTRRHPLLWYDAASKEQRELRYATNMSSPFVDEQKGEVTLGHITFRDGTLNVPKEKIALQKLLSLYHPMKTLRYKEHIPQQIADDQIEIIEWEIEALNAARNMDVDMAEAIVRVEYGSKVNKMSSKELRRDLLLLAKQNPKLFLSLASDENVQLRNFAINAVEAQIIRVSPDNRSVHWTSNDRKLLNVPFDENPYSAIAAWFKTDEGIEVFKSIEKRL